MTHRHTVECISQVGGKLVCSVMEKRKKSIGGTHRHSGACEDRWGSTLCLTHVKRGLHGVVPVRRLSGTYSLGKPIVGQGMEGPGKALVERIPILSDGAEVGLMFFNPSSYKDSPWQYSLTKLRWKDRGGRKGPPAHSGIGHDGNAATAQAALIGFANSAESIDKWYREHKA